MYPTRSIAVAMQTLGEVRQYYQLPDAVWRAFIQVVGDPGDDVRLLGSLPRHVVTAALERAQLQDGAQLTAIQASHVGMVYNLVKKIIYTKEGNDWDGYVETSLFGTPPTQVPVATNQSNATGSTERKMKLSQVLDQSDDGEFIVQSELTRAKWYMNYKKVVGGFPPEEEEPTIEQLSGLQRRLEVQNVAPFVDFAIFVPFGQRHLKASRLRTYVLTAEGYVTKDLPGPANYIQWRLCFRILRASLLMLEATSLSAMIAYEQWVEQLTRLYPNAWHLIYSADELARSGHSNRMRARVLLDLQDGGTAPQGWDAAKPWDWVYAQLPHETAFWQTQVHSPALTWIASGSRGTPRTPAEQLAMAHLQGGLKAITPAVEQTSQDGNGANTTTPTRARREARKRKKERDREEPRRFSKSYGSGGQDGKGEGKGGKQKCFGWNNGNGNWHQEFHVPAKPQESTNAPNAGARVTHQGIAPRRKTDERQSSRRRRRRLCCSQLRTTQR